jgi:hypothetical protein
VGVALGTGILLQAIDVSRYGGGRSILVDDPGFRLADSGPRTWTLAFVVLSLGGAVVLALPTVRQALVMTRVAGDPPRFDASRLVGAMVGLLGSSMLVGLTGVLYVRWLGVADGSSTNKLLLPAVGAAMSLAIGLIARAINAQLEAPPTVASPTVASSAGVPEPARGPL